MLRVIHCTQFDKNTFKWLKIISRSLLEYVLYIFMYYGLNASINEF